MEHYNNYLSSGQAAALSAQVQDNTKKYPALNSFISPYWVTAMIVEMENLFTAAGLSFDNADRTQLLTAIQTVAGGSATYTIQTGNFTASFGGSYLCDVEGGSITATLPLAPAAGDNGKSIKFIKSDPTLAGNDLILGRNSETIMDAASDLTIAASDGENITITAVWDNTAGTWKIAIG